MAQGTGDGARAPRRRASTSRRDDGIYGEILARIAGIEGRVESVGGDAREARDGVLQLTAGLNAQGIPAKVAELDGKIDVVAQTARSDLVNATTQIKREVRDKHDALVKRVADLEAFRNRIDGASGLLGWIGKNTPWLVAVLLAGLAALGFKDKLP